MVRTEGINSGIPLIFKNGKYVMYSVLILASFLIEVAIWYTNDSTVSLFIIGIPILVTAARLLSSGIKYIANKRYQKGILSMLASPMLMSLFALPSAFLLMGDEHLDFARDTAYYLKLTLHEKQYLEEIKLTVPDDRGFRFKLFNWGVNTSDAGESTELIYDESDEVALPPEQRSLAWWRSTGYNPETYMSGCPTEVRRIKSHFYALRDRCG